MAETKAKIWLTNKKKNIIEVTATDNAIAMDVYSSKKNLLKHYWYIFKHIMFVKKPLMNDKQGVADAVAGFIDEYYEEHKAHELKNHVLEELELKEKNKHDISYIG